MGKGIVMTTDFAYIMTRILLFTGMGISFFVTIGSAWLMMTARVYGNDPQNIERSKRIIEAYARVCVISTLTTIVLGAFLTFTLRGDCL